jgi:hypothetical protein
MKQRQTQDKFFSEPPSARVQPSNLIVMIMPTPLKVFEKTRPQKLHVKSQSTDRITREAMCEVRETARGWADFTSAKCDDESLIKVLSFRV